MLCEVAAHGSFLTTWLALTAIAAVLLPAISAAVFYRSYWAPSFEQWQRKTNAEYPPPALVRREALTMGRGLLAVTLCPALSLHGIEQGWSKAYCGLSQHGAGYLLLSFLVVWIGTDLYEFLYHRLGHLWRFGWREHKAHHVFHNPTPFAVIADGSVDQLVRAAPLLLVPLVIPIQMDLLFFTFAAFFYGYGAYLHWGHELRWPDAHHPWLNTSFQHYLHHARSTWRRPLHTGFFFKLWDRLAGSATDPGPGPCLCSKCCVARGERSREAFDRLHRPDYSVLLRPSFWWSGEAPPGGARPPAVRAF